MSLTKYAITGAPGLETTSVPGFGSSSENMGVVVRGHRFLFTVGGASEGILATASFKEISGGFKAGQESKEYREGGFARSTVRKIPGGLMTFDDITLSKGVLTDYTGMWDVTDYFLEGNNETCWPEAQIDVYNMKGDAAVYQYKLVNVWPKEWSMDNSLSADSSDILIEKVVLSCEGIARIK